MNCHVQGSALGNLIDAQPGAPARPGGQAAPPFCWMYINLPGSICGLHFYNGWSASARGYASRLPYLDVRSLQALAECKVSRRVWEPVFDRLSDGVAVAALTAGGQPHLQFKVMS